MQFWKRHTWQVQKKWENKMQVEKGAKIANGGKMERTNATWKGKFDKWKIHGRNQCKLEGGDIICGEYRPIKCNQGKGKVPNAAHMETSNKPGQGSKTCAEDKGNIKLEKGSPRWTREAEEKRPMLRLTPAKWTADQPKGKVPDPNWGLPKLDTFWKKSRNNYGKKREKKTKQKTKKQKTTKKMGRR